MPDQCSLLAAPAEDEWTFHAVGNGAYSDRWMHEPDSNLGESKAELERLLDATVDAAIPRAIEENLPSGPGGEPPCESRPGPRGESLYTEIKIIRGRPPDLAAHKAAAQRIVDGRPVPPWSDVDEWTVFVISAPILLIQPAHLAKHVESKAVVVASQPYLAHHGEQPRTETVQ